MSRYRQSFNEALAQVEKWSKDVEVKSTGEHKDKTVAQLEKEVEALRGKPNNEKEMGGLLFAIRAKQGWKKGEGSTGVGEATQIKHEKGEVKVDKAERGERKAGESEDDYEDRESGGERGFRPDPKKKKGKKQDDLDRDDEAQATRSKDHPTAESKLPPHLSKFLDKKGNPNKEAQARMDAGRKKRDAAAKVKDVTPKGYGPNEEKDKPEQGKVYALTGKSDQPSIARGDSWKKSEVKKKEKSKKEDMSLYYSDKKLGLEKPKVWNVKTKKFEEQEIDEVNKHQARAFGSALIRDKSPRQLKDPNKERDALIKAVAKSPKQQALAKKQKKEEMAEGGAYGGSVKDAPKVLKKAQDRLGLKVKSKSTSPSGVTKTTYHPSPQIKGMISKKEDIETYSQRITRDMRMGNLSGVGGTTVFPKTDDGVTQQEAAGDMTTENLEFKVKIKGIPSFYVPAKTAARVKQSLRKQLKHPDDIESIVRVTKASQKIDFRKRAQGKFPDDEEAKE